ncbi:MAG TPA: glycosyltransferase [Anaerolineaceae bacterium]|nr:glycosyltransferase [Anaerolineaceae bacterium]
MKILFTTFNQEGKGSFLRALALAKELTKLGHQLTVLCASAQNTFEDKHIDGVRLVCFPWGKRFLHGYNSSEVRARKRWLGKQKFDIVHAFDMRPSCAKPAFQAKRHGALMLSDWADLFGKGGSVEERANPIARAILRPVESYNERVLRKKAHGLTCICSHLYKMAQQLNFPDDQLLLLHNGFNQTISPRTSKLEARQHFGINPDLHIAGSLGAFFNKDFQVLKSAIDYCQNQQSVAFLHIGQGDALLQDANIITTGRISDTELSLALQACDILLLPMADIPANHGRFPLKFSEYISAGRPVLATRIGDVPDFIEEHQCGYVSAPNPTEFARTLCDALSNPEEREKRGQNALALSQSETFSWHNRAKQLDTFYQTLLKNSKKR